MICLNMIVKNEAHCIARCLRSVRPYIDAAYICDTGSTDETKSVIRAALGLDFPCVIFDMPWEGFGPTRTRAAALASEMCAKRHPDARLLFIDADETLEVAGDFSPPDADLVVVPSIYPEGVEGTDRLLARASIPWVFEPITHETIRRADGLPLNAVLWEGARIREWNDSARRNSGEKLVEDVALLSAWVIDRPTDMRAWFYLGMSLRNLGRLPEAKVAYLKCIESGAPFDHCAMAWLAVGRCEVLMGENPCRSLTNSYAANRDRAEALCSLADYYLERGDFLTAELYARQACSLPMPAHSMFLDRSCYTWKRWSTFGQALCGAGRFREALEVHAVDRGEPPEEKARIEAGMAWIREKLGA